MSTELIPLAVLMFVATYPSRALGLLTPGLERLPKVAFAYLQLVGPAVLAALVRRIDDGTISGKIAKELLPEMISTKKPPDALIAGKGLVQISDEGPLREAVAKVVAENPAQVASYRGGKAATIGWFVGQVMKATGGKANPGIVNRLLKEALES